MRRAASMGVSKNDTPGTATRRRSRSGHRQDRQGRVGFYDDTRNQTAWQSSHKPPAAALARRSEYLAIHGCDRCAAPSVPATLDPRCSDECRKQLGGSPTSDHRARDTIGAFAVREFARCCASVCMPRGMLKQARDRFIDHGRIGTDSSV